MSHALEHKEKKRKKNTGKKTQEKTAGKKHRKNTRKKKCKTPGINTALKCSLSHALEHHEKKTLSKKHSSKMFDQSKVYQRFFFCFGASKRIENTSCRDASLKTPNHTYKKNNQKIMRLSALFSQLRRP